jgi:lauroyl/myristoyl acyltransferase
MVSAGDLARWLFWVKLREALPVEKPGVVAMGRPFWRLQYAAAHGKSLMEDEYRRCGIEPNPALIKAAYRVAWRSHFEELLLGKLTAENLHNYLDWEGRDNLEAALARKKGAILVFPHAGHVMMIIAATSLWGYSYTQYAARGLAPKEVAEAHPEVFGHNPWREAVREAREKSEDRLPAKFLTLETPVRKLFRSLANNELVGIAFDGRIGRRFVKVPYLGREALLNPGAFRMAADTGAALVPTFVEVPAHGKNRMITRPALIPDGKNASSLMAELLQAEVEPWIRAHPEHYGIWLLHCRLRNTVDDHPFFIDQALDDRWKVHLN